MVSSQLLWLHLTNWRMQHAWEVEGRGSFYKAGMTNLSIMRNVGSRLHKQINSDANNTGNDGERHTLTAVHLNQINRVHGLTLHLTD